LRRRIEAMWGCPAFCYYGSMECGPIGLECSEQDGLHIATNFAAVEVIDTEDDILTLAGERLGEIVVTPLWRYATPLIRYRTGDLARWDDSPCQCGLPGRRLRVHGRRDDVLCVGGRKFHVIDIEDGLLSLPEVSPWFQLKPGANVLRVLLPATNTDAKHVEKQVCDWVGQHMNVDCIVDYVKVPAYGGGKLLRLCRD
jgi:phenylacetate-CoA ligase